MLGWHPQMADDVDRDVNTHHKDRGVALRTLGLACRAAHKPAKLLLPVATVILALGCVGYHCTLLSPALLNDGCVIWFTSIKSGQAESGSLHPGKTVLWRFAPLCNCSLFPVLS